MSKTFKIISLILVVFILLFVFIKKIPSYQRYDGYTSAIYLTDNGEIGVGGQEICKCFGIVIRPKSKPDICLGITFNCD